MRAELERRGLPIGPLALIAGIALTQQAILVTRNTREFSRLPDLAIADWYDWAFRANMKALGLQSAQVSA